MRSQKSDRHAWLIAWVLALALHAIAILGFRLIHSDPVESAGPEVVQLLLSNPETGEEPTLFSELPPNRAEPEHEKEDFLSNVTSRARDLVLAGDAPLPRTQGEVDAPMVGLEPNGARPPSPADATQQPSEAKPEDAGIAPHAPKLSLERLVGDAALQGTPGSAGNSDIHQPEMDNPDGNVGLTGDVSLNTTAWDYAPWLQRYCRELMHRWIAPPAYTMGILKEGGWALIEVEISPRGKLLRCDLLDEQGHPALIIAAQGAVRSVAPIEPLPAGFPEPTLILRLRMIYPRYPGPETDRAPNSSRDPRAR